jgi:hypothetical protein
MIKRGELFHQTIIQVILVALILAIFLMATAGKVNARDVKQQVLEKQSALLIDSATPGMSFEIQKVNINGNINKVEVKDGKIFISVAGLNSLKGYPYFSKYSVVVRDEGSKFIIEIK